MNKGLGTCLDVALPCSFVESGHLGCLHVVGMVWIQTRHGATWTNDVEYLFLYSLKQPAFCTFRMIPSNYSVHLNHTHTRTQYTQCTFSSARDSVLTPKSKSKNQNELMSEYRNEDA